MKSNYLCVLNNLKNNKKMKKFASLFVVAALAFMFSCGNAATEEATPAEAEVTEATVAPADSCCCGDTCKCDTCKCEAAE